ncbi:uncharacterized protein LOC126551758 [Aphis gossypii]|uniref:Uncharacterized protein n=1 Tax=Aphis gossypii TaxID=80765 RepID=A0A9P0J5P3_APHGO|nr:uncharacterized protein LOC126551758 [Aphis gossypii]CAH1730906.1 unnamed protein product [Aphis gossypii]
MESITAFYILLAVTSSWAAKSEMKQNQHGVFFMNIANSGVKPSVCPPLGLGVNFEVSTIQTRSRMYGCAYLEIDKVVSSTPLLNLWLERPVETSVHGHCDDMTNMDHFEFECLSNYDPIDNAEEKVHDWNYIKLVERRPYLKNSSETSRTLFYRCAVYDVHDSSVEGVKIIRMAISAPRVGDMHRSQCEGLSKTMGQDKLPFVPEGRRLWPNGSMYIYMLGRPYFDQDDSK